MNNVEIRIKNQEKTYNEQVENQSIERKNYLTYEERVIGSFDRSL